ncbi:MAG TPA: hypothetical protein VFG04_04040 [Planctomycetaceae bacterium]|jgi:hypothetical protein|nr:hypothetical protein [Planctomycetaceae bacterium]
MKSFHSWIVLLSAALVVAAPATAIRAQEGTLVRAAAKEAVEFFAGQAERQGAKAVATELTEFGGETAVREVFEQVAKETGEEGVKRLVQLSKSYGLDAVRAAKVAPRLTPLAEGVAPELAPSALRALLRPEERALLEPLSNELATGALEAAARHPGVGAQVVGELGPAGLKASQQYGTDAIIQLVKSPEAKSIAALPASQKTSLLKRMAQFIEQHPKTVLGAAGVGLFVRYKDELLGDKGEIVVGPDGTPIYVPKTGLIERSSNQILAWLLPVVAGVVGLWGANRLFWAWRWSKVSYAAKAAGLPSRDST